MRKRLNQRDSFYNFDHEAVAKHFKSDPVFCNEFCVNNEYYPVAVYKVHKPDKKLGHKDYLLLQLDPQNSKSMIVRGMTTSEMKPFRYQQGVQCLQCEKLLYSINRHDYKTCGCNNETMVDGGRDYLRYGGKDCSLVSLVEIDLIKNCIHKNSNSLQ